MKFDCVFICFVVIVANSKAVKSPRVVMIKAVIFSEKGIVITGVFVWCIFNVIKKPVIMLPQAKRLMGLITVRLFSLIGESELNRGCFINTKNTIRRL